MGRAVQSVRLKMCPRSHPERTNTTSAQHGTMYLLSMRRSSYFRFLVLGFLLVLFAGVGADQGSPLAPQTPPSPHNRIGVYLTSYALTKPGLLEQVLDATDEGKLNAVVVNVKNMHGEVTYDSAVPLARMIGAASDRLDMRTLVPALKEHGCYLIARQVLFYDPKLAAYLGRQGPWVLPTDDQAVEYNLAIAEEVASVGFDEIQFDYVRFPDGGELSPIYDDRYTAVNRFLKAARQLISGRAYLSVDVFGRVLWEWNRKRIDPIGQSLEEMAGCVDLISPMLYPSHYREQRYKDDPYLVVQEALASGKSRVTTPFRPYLQAFDQAIPPGFTLETYIRAQIQAAQGAGANGYLFWNPSCDYEALYRALD